MACVKRSMNTTMMNHPCRGSTPNKRKDRDFLKPSRFVKPSFHRAAAKTQTTSKGSEPASKNQLLAGYLAYEFLNKGTLFGQAWEPARAEAKPVSEEPRKLKEKRSEGEPNEGQGQLVERNERYVEVADLLKGGRVHLPGIVNPTQLAGFLQL